MSHAWLKPSAGILELLLNVALQLPVLKDLQRVIDELAFGASTNLSQAAPNSRLIVEQVCCQDTNSALILMQPACFRKAKNVWRCCGK